MPMSAVERIECVPFSEIEYVGDRAVLQYRGELIPLEDEGGVLREWSAAEESETSVVPEADARTVTLLICLRPEQRGTRRVGLVVRRVLDVSSGTLLADNAAACVEQLALVKDRVTTVHRGFAQQQDTPPNSLLQEVA